ncbi:MAG: acyl-CoA/acyl-ACP dehydrogenase [Nitrospirae bacterium]|nr:acyl-CoA/acyl-ACP dehydrogenase [Nitrospirota bacterium]
MNFDLSDEQKMLQESARSCLAKEFPVTTTRKAAESLTGYPEELWKKMADLGWLGLALPESYGGLGLGFVDLAVVLEEMGRELTPGPFFSTVVLAGLTLADAGSAEQKKLWLPRIASGGAKGTFAWVERSGEWDGGALVTAARRAGGKYVLNGTKYFVTYAHVADFILCLARTGKALTVFLVDAKAPGVKVEPMAIMDSSRRVSKVEFRNVAVGPRDVVGKPGAGAPIAEGVLSRACVAMAAEMAGGAQRVLEMSIEYAKARVQFGKPIGSYQAIKHKCSNMILEVESARSAAYYSAWANQEGSPDVVEVSSIAKAYASEAYRKVTGEAIQLHGGIGFTWEHPLHLYFRRAKFSELMFGDPAFHRERMLRAVEKSAA